MTTFDAVLTNWATDQGLGHDAALMALGGTSAFLEARASFAAGATEQVVRSHLDAALAAVGRVPFVTLD